MIEHGQKFKCYDKEGKLAFGGRVFICDRWEKSRRKGAYIVDVTDEWHLSEKHFTFEAVK